MAETTETAQGDVAHHVGDQDHHEIHMPPNSWVPISTAGALTALLVGFVTGWWLVGVGGAWLLASLVQWLRAARSEYAELPD